MGKLTPVTLMKVVQNKMGAVPPGFAHGTIVGLNDQELETLRKTPHLQECFEEILIRQWSPYADAPSIQTSESTVDSKT